MTIEKDKYIDPNEKARWGFGGTAENITVGPQTVGETGGVETARTPVDETAARNNGGGADALSQGAVVAGQSNTSDPRDSLTVAQIKEQLEAKDVEYPSTANKAELLQLLKAQDQE
ncbi:hypothetical protein JQR88_10880 [Pseudomonas luteola]|uniref:HeH/LEM domain-containing protein n=1 Tax=Pseudomonas luteola TaxID=47886 RepID=UPI003D9FDFFD